MRNWLTILSIIIISLMISTIYIYFFQSHYEHSYIGLNRANNIGANAYAV